MAAAPTCQPFDSILRRGTRYCILVVVTLHTDADTSTEPTEASRWAMLQGSTCYGRTNNDTARACRCDGYRGTSHSAILQDGTRSQRRHRRQTCASSVDHHQSTRRIESSRPSPARGQINYGHRLVTERTNDATSVRTIIRAGTARPTHNDNRACLSIFTHLVLLPPTVIILQWSFLLTLG